jgi:PAS domain S-box-containing protein
MTDPEQNNPTASESSQDNACGSVLGNESAKIQQDRYRVLIEEVEDGFYEADLKGVFLFFNNALCRIFGYPRDEIQNRNYQEFMDGQNAKSAFDRFNHIYSTGKGFTDIIWEIVRKDGQRRFVEISAGLIVDENGNRCGFRGIVRDITDKYKIQKALKASEKKALEQYRASRRAEIRYRAFLDFLPDPVFVFNLDGTVYYLNPAFEKVFGWTLAELQGKRIPFVPDSLKEETRLGTQRLMEEKTAHGVETKRLTKDGRLLDILLEGAIIYEAEDEPAGHVLILRNITQEKLAERTNNAFFRIAKALPRYRGLDALLEFIIREVKGLLGVEGAMVILLDEEKKEFFFRVAAFDDSETGNRFKEVRFPIDKGVAGHVYRTGKPFIVPDTAESPYFFKQVDERAEYETKNMLDVPLRIKERFVGVLCAVNKMETPFDPSDVFVLNTIASMVALPIENARVNDALNRSYEEVQSLSRAKENVIHHLSHELKTPLSVLSASMGLLRKKYATNPDDGHERILNRAERNLKRILDMQYEIEDILREKKYQSYHLLNNLLDACTDELEALASDAPKDADIVDAIRSRVDAEFGPKASPSRKIRLDRFVKDHIGHIESQFSHRRCTLKKKIDETRPVFIPSDVLEKILGGLIRNAVENTPEKGEIEITVSDDPDGPKLQIRDFGVGITLENQKHLFVNYFTTHDTMQYGSKNRYDFNAGGRGFDLLRIKIFSERYQFKIRMTSNRCRYIPGDSDLCPGSIETCSHCTAEKDCHTSGGTTVVVRFLPANGSRFTERI